MQFSELAGYFKKIELTTSRNAITEILADLFRAVKAEEIDKIVYLLQGRVAPLYEAVEFGMAEKFIIRAIAKAYGVSADVVQKSFKKEGDLGSTAESLYHGQHKKMTAIHVYEQLLIIARTGGQGSQEKKIAALAELFGKSDPLSARFLARIPLDKLRLGFSEMTILDGLSWMAVGDKSLRPKLEDAYNVRADIGYIAKILKEKGIKGLVHVHARVGAPILAALCQRLPNADEMINKMGEVAVEGKYDGVRAQIHVTKYEVKTFSRNLENTTAMFPELSEIQKQLNAHEVILDSEAAGVDPTTGKLIPFQQTMTRKRKHEITRARAIVPLKFFVFDVLYRDGKDLLNMPLSFRRNELEQTVKKGNMLVVSPQIVTRNAADIRSFHDAQIKKGLEGAVVKKWESPYTPGRRNFSWVKFKEEEGRTGKLTDTIDGVIMGYSRGQGKRSGFGIGMFLVGVRRGDLFVTVTKVGTGVSDQLWKELHGKLEAIKSKEKPKEYSNVSKLFTPDVWVIPKTVVEIAGDDLTKSSNHGAGIAVRFPRLVRIRSDKSPAQATTMREVRQMYKNQFS